MKITDQQISSAIKELGFEIDQKKDSTEFAHTCGRINEKSYRHEIIIRIKENAKDGKIAYCG